MRQVLDLSRIVKCSQMSNPKTGQGSGGDRCGEATLAMIDGTLKIGPEAQAGADPEQLMYQFTEFWFGSDVSGLVDPKQLADWLKAHSTTVSMVELTPSFGAVGAIIDAGHLAVFLVNDYRALQLFDGSDPYQWNPANQPAAGHIGLIAGTDDDYQGRGQSLVVYDPLRSLAGQPADYSFASFLAAGFSRLYEVVGPTLAIPVQPKTYTVIQGDSLWAIAARPEVYGDGREWPAIYEANKAEIGSDPSLIFAGQVYVIPPLNTEWVGTEE